jgi:hypothetical protein
VRIEVTGREGSPDAYPSTHGLSPAVRVALLDEYRHMPQSWLAMFARTGD